MFLFSPIKVSPFYLETGHGEAPGAVSASDGIRALSALAGADVYITIVLTVFRLSPHNYKVRVLIAS